MYVLAGLGDAELRDLAHLRLGLSADLVRHAPPELDAVDLEGPVAGVVDLDLLRDTPRLVGGQVAAGLGLKLEFVALVVKS